MVHTTVSTPPAAVKKPTEENTRELRFAAFRVKMKIKMKFCAIGFQSVLQTAVLWQIVVLCSK